jgi:hypothetical protein
VVILILSIHTTSTVLAEITKKKVNYNKRYKYVTIRHNTSQYVTLRTAQTAFVCLYTNRHENSYPLFFYINCQEHPAQRAHCTNIMKNVAVLIITSLFILSLILLQNRKTKAFPELVHACLCTITQGFSHVISYRLEGQWRWDHFLQQNIHLSVAGRLPPTQSAA